MSKTYIKELLESDDELPSDFDEAAPIPAYLIDNRFDNVTFKWINKSNIQTFKMESNLVDEVKTQHGSIFNQLHSKPILKKGVLNKHDLLCIKSIEGSTGNSTFIWLINFLLYKDLQANYVFLKSCLVSC